MGKMRVRLMREVTNAHSYFRNLWHVYGGLAMLARSLGHQVTGSDANVYPPMSTLLENPGHRSDSGVRRSQLDPQPDLDDYRQRYDPR